MKRDKELWTHVKSSEKRLHRLAWGHELHQVFQEEKSSNAPHSLNKRLRPIKERIKKPRSRKSGAKYVRGEGICYGSVVALKAAQGGFFAFDPSSGRARVLHTKLDSFSKFTVIALGDGDCGRKQVLSGEKIGLAFAGDKILGSKICALVAKGDSGEGEKEARREVVVALERQRIRSIAAQWTFVCDRPNGPLGHQERVRLEHNCLQAVNDLTFGTVLRQPCFAEQDNGTGCLVFKLVLCSKPAEEEKKLGIPVLNHAKDRLTASKLRREKRQGFAQGVSNDLRRVSSFSGISTPEDRLRANALFKRLTRKQKPSSWHARPSVRRRRAVGNLNATKELAVRGAVYRYLLGTSKTPKNMGVVRAKAEMVAARHEAKLHVNVWKAIANARLRREETKRSELHQAAIKLQKHFRNWHASRWKRRFGLVDDTIKHLQLNVMRSPKQPEVGTVSFRQQAIQTKRNEAPTVHAPTIHDDTKSWLIDRANYGLEALTLQQPADSTSSIRGERRLRNIAYLDVKNPRDRPVSAAMLRATRGGNKRPMSAGPFR